MRSRFATLVIMVVSLASMAAYVFLNIGKLQMAWSDWTDIGTGQPAAVAEFMLSGESVFQTRLKTSDIYDATGRRQVHFIHLPGDVFSRAQREIELARLEIDHQEMGLSVLPGNSALLALDDGRKIYLLAEGELKYMMTAIWNERIRSRSIVQCTTTRLCQSVSISSNDWSPVQGPFSESEYVTERRGLPRGRWLSGPKSIINIRSMAEQTLSMQIHLLGVTEDQVIDFGGVGAGARKIEASPVWLDAAGRRLHPQWYAVILELKPGENYLEVSFSKWLQPGGEDAHPLAAYATAIVIQETGL